MTPEQMAPVLFSAAVLLLVMLIAGLVMGWNAAVRKFGQRASDLARQVEDLEGISQRDPARMGIDIGKRYTTDKVRRTLDEIDAETGN